MPVTLRRLLGVLVALAVAAALLPVAPASARHYPFMTITFVRHGESEANAAGVIDTIIPGAPLTAAGQSQAKQAARAISGSFPDSVFSSPLLRAEQTAQYLADEVGEPVQVLPGLREIDAGSFEGLPAQDASGMLDTLDAWVSGDRGARIPGSIDGDEFDARFDAAVQSIWDGGYSNPVVYSHGGAIWAWTMMNVNNAPADLKPDLGNTDHVVVRGDPATGWTLVNWNGRTFE
jgi:broad specificity phosphatase PhoE